MWLMARMTLLVAALFGIIYALIVIVGSLLGIGNFLVYGGIAIVLMLVQFAIGPKMVEWTMKVKYVSSSEEPELHEIVDKLAKKAGITKPKIGVSPTQVPNAFAFGRSRKGSRICVTKGIQGLLNKTELEAVLGHEISHIVHRDVMFITLISVIPTIAWYIAWSSMFSRNERGNPLIGVVAFFIYFLTNLLVLYASRIREYYADRGAVRLGQKPNELASALYKLVYGAVKVPKYELKQVEGMKAFFATDPSRAAQEFADLKALDKDLSGSIDQKELESLRSSRLKLSRGDRIFELLSTHPNMLKRIAVLSSYQE